MQWKTATGRIRPKSRPDVNLNIAKPRPGFLESGIKGKTAMSIDKAITSVQKELTAAPANPVAEAKEARPRRKVSKDERQGLCSLGCSHSLASAPSSAALGADMRPDRESQLPEQLVGVGIDEAIDVQVPRDLTFTNQDGKQVTLGSLFDRGKPTVLTLNYTNCPLLCNVQLSGFVNALGAIEDDLGEIFNVVTVSIDPEDDFKRAKQVLNRYEDDYGRPLGDHWQYLVATEREIDAVTKAVGFGYHLDTETGEYQHTSALIVLGPRR